MDAERGNKLSPEIYVYATNKNFFNVYDALRIDKVKLEIAGYDPSTNRQTGHASAWLDKDDARLLSHLTTNMLFSDATGGKWERLGGSQRDDGSIESRTLTVEWDQGENGRFARFPYRITITNGPGRKTQTGGVSPAGEPAASMFIRLPELDMIKLMLTIGDYIRAYETAHHHRLVADKVRSLREKLADRSARQTEPLAEPPSLYEAKERPAGAGRSAVSEARPPLKAIPGGNLDNRRDTRPRPNLDRAKAS